MPVQYIPVGGELLLKGYGAGYWARVLKLEMWEPTSKMLVVWLKLEALGKL